MRLWLVALSIVFCACCATPATPPPVRIFNAQPLIHEGWYEVVHSEVKRCAALFGTVRRGDFDDIEWYVVPANAMPGFSAIWSPPNRIYIDARFVINEGTIRHELAHHLLQAGDNSHENPAFVVCSGEV